MAASGETDGSGTPTARSVRAGAVGLLVWIALVVAAVVWPLVSPLPERGGVHAPPFYGRWDLHGSYRLLPAIAVALLLVAWWPTAVERWSPRRLAAASGAVSVLWGLAVAASDGIERWWTPLASRYGYLDVAPDTGTGEFVRTYVDRLGTYPTHVKSHPPLLPLVLRLLDAVGLGGAGGAMVAVLAMWALGVAAVVFVADRLGGADLARRASAPVALAPVVVFAFTTYDAFFTGWTAVAVAVLVVAVTSDGPTSDVAAALGGLLAAAALYLSYGFAPLGLIPLLVAAQRRRLRPVVVAAVSAGAVVAAFTAAGFWWFDGLAAARHHYEVGISQFRPYAYFVFAGNPAALALTVGPVTAVGLGHLASSGPRVWWRDSWPLPVAGALVAVAAADLTGLSNAEVERIWLPFMPWICLAAAAAWDTIGCRRSLAVTLVTALVLQAALVTPW